VTDKSAKAAYEAFAPIYDDFNHANDYEAWFGVLLPELEKRGLRKGRLLDVGCGTGRAFEPMLQRGWGIQGCDVSREMLARARRKFGDAVSLDEANARDLPVYGKFELVWALNDIVNYLTEDGDLERALVGMRANLTAGGLILFDADTIGLFQANFASGDSDWMSVGQWTWKGLSSDVEPGGTLEAEVSGDGVETHVHRERHYTGEQVRGAMAAAGLECLAALGQHDVDGKVVLSESPDEMRDHRVIYIACAAGRRGASSSVEATTG
jgi:SAM-dependent methyltransferase